MVLPFDGGLLLGDILLMMWTLEIVDRRRREGAMKPKIVRRIIIAAGGVMGKKFPTTRFSRSQRFRIRKTEARGIAMRKCYLFVKKDRHARVGIVARGLW